SNAQAPIEPDELKPYVDAYQGSLRVTPQTRTRLANVSFESPNPQLAAQIVNLHAERFITLNLEDRYNSTQVASEFLDKQLQQMRAKLEKAEEAIRGYSQDHQITFLDESKSDEGKNTEMQKLADLESTYTKAQMDRIEKESYARQMRSQGGAIDPTKTPLRSQYAAKLIDLRREDSDLAVSFGPEW